MRGSSDVITSYSIHYTKLYETFAEQLAGLRLVLVSRKFWRITPWAVAAQASYLSLISLWSGPWLRDVAHFPRPAVARTLMAVAISYNFV